jgi:TctA family transporter
MAPFLLAMVLGPMMEIAFRQSLLYGDPFVFFKRSIPAVFLFISLFFLVISFFPYIARKRRKIEKVLGKEGP